MSTVSCGMCGYGCRRVESVDGLIIHVCRIKGCGWRQATLKLEWIT